MAHPNPYLVEKFAAIEEVAAIALGGSRAGGVNDDASDYDLYVLTTGRIDPAIREHIVREVADTAPYEIAIPWWGDEDALAIDGRRYELAYFDVGWFSDGIDAVVSHHRASQGYTTSFINTVAKMQPLHDPAALISGWKERIAVYPEALVTAIIATNYPVSCTIQASYRNQIARAIDLGDAVAVNHRVAAFLACVFDIAFAVLRMWHPGEKRQLQYLQRHADALPIGFAEHITAILHHTAPDRLGDLLAAVDMVVSDVDYLVEPLGQAPFT